MIFFRILIAAAVLFTIRAGTDYVTFALVTAIGAVGSNLVGFVRTPKVSRFTFRDLQPFRHLKPLLFLFGSAATVSIYIYLDSVLLGFLAGDKAVGLYAAALRIDKTVVLSLAAAGSVLIPRISWHIQQGNISEYSRIAQKSLDFMFLLAIPAMIGIIALAPELVALLAGPGFTASVLTTRIGALLLPIIGFNAFFGMQILIPNGREKIVFISTAIAAMVDIILNFSLIPALAHNGAIIANVAAEATVIAVQITLAGRNYRVFRILNQRTIRYCGAGVAMGACVFGIRLFSWPPLAMVAVGLPIGAVIYFGLLLATKETLTLEVCTIAIRALKGKAQPGLQ